MKKGIKDAFLFACDFILFLIFFLGCKLATYGFALYVYRCGVYHLAAEV